MCCSFYQKNVLCFSQPTPDVLDGDQSSYIAQHLFDCNEYVLIH